MSEYGDRFNSAVAAELRAQRARVGITVDQVVSSTGLAKSTVLNYLHARRDIPLPALADICQALGTTQLAIFQDAERAIQR
jgi:transcriptional regulator with XRE-family HTH domain